MTDGETYRVETVRRTVSGRFRRLAEALLADVRGVAAVEFGFIAPVMMVMMIGAVELTRAVAINQRFSQVTSMVADLISREDKLTADDVNAIYGIAKEVMAPYDDTTLKIAIYPVLSSPTNASNTLVYPTTTNRPSYHGASVPAKCQAYALTAGLLGKNESVIAVETSYKFAPLFLGYVMNARDWADKAFSKPRKSLCVAFDGATCTTTCF